jgi:hypothetical protein
MMEIVFNVECHQPRAYFPAESGQPPGGAHHPRLWKQYAPTLEPIRAEDPNYSR